MIREVITYKIDGIDREFTSFEDAQRFLDEKKNRADVNYYKYIHSSYNGKRLLNKHALSEHGIWEIKGEDDNADFGGYHYQPSLGLVEGTLEQAIRYAVTLDRFYTGGGGGDIVAREAPKVLKLEK